MALALGLPAMTTSAQDANPGQPPQRGERPNFRPPGGPQDGAGADGPRRPVPPLMAALDANGDGVIDETEIKNAAEALKKLDKNGDGKITAEEIRPQRPGGPGAGGPGFGPEGQGPGNPPPGDGQNRPQRPQRPRPANQ